MVQRLFRFYVRRFSAPTAVAVVVIAGCHSSAPGALSASCSLNSDCNSPLVCVFSRCHNACVNSGDCPAGERCVPATPQYNVCQLPVESGCDEGGTCVSSEVCGSDGQCRAPCMTAQDCPGANAGGEACLSVAVQTGGTNPVCVVSAAVADDPILIDAGVLTPDGSVLSSGPNGLPSGGPQDAAPGGAEGSLPDGAPSDGAPPVACSANFTISDVTFYGTGSPATGTSPCTSIDITSAAITEPPSTFSSSGSSGAIVFGSSPDLWQTFTAASGSAPTLSFIPSSGAIGVATTLPDVAEAFAEVGLVFEQTSCANASAYEGIEFTLSGDLGGCGLVLLIEDTEGTTASQDSNRGSCTAGAAQCTPPHYVITQQDGGTIQVPFSALTGGSPEAGLDPTAILSVQWVLGVP